MPGFSLLKYVKQYQNDALCAKWNNNIPLAELDGAGMNFALDSQVINELREYFKVLDLEDITGMVYTLGDGDYSEVYVTESSRPYDLQAIYHPLSYYVES
jgi:predicted hydrocarbon binding protein